MDRTISPVRSLSGVVRLPGDKSISHRYAMLASIAEGRSEIRNYSTGADCASTLACMRALGVSIARDGNRVMIEGVGLDGLKHAAEALDAGNSGSTIRMLSGILAGQPFETTLFGDESLSRRPMRRILTPLEAMGAKIAARDGEFPPLTIRGGKLRPIDYVSPVASAQVKSAVLLAGLFAEGTTSVTEPLATRNHSEIALRELGRRSPHRWPEGPHRGPPATDRPAAGGSLRHLRRGVLPGRGTATARLGPYYRRRRPQPHAYGRARRVGLDGSEHRGHPRGSAQRRTGRRFARPRAFRRSGARRRRDRGGNDGRGNR